MFSLLQFCCRAIVDFWTSFGCSLLFPSDCESSSLCEKVTSKVFLSFALV